MSEDTDSVADHDPSSVAILPPNQCTLSKREMYLLYLQNVFVSASALSPRERCVCYICKKYLSVTEMYCEMYRFSLRKNLLNSSIKYVYPCFYQKKLFGYDKRVYNVKNTMYFTAGLNELVSQ